MVVVYLLKVVEHTVPDPPTRKESGLPCGINDRVQCDKRAPIMTLASSFTSVLRRVIGRLASAAIMSSTGLQSPLRIRVVAPCRWDGSARAGSSTVSEKA